MIRNYIEVYDDYFIFYYGFTKEYIYIRDIIKCEKSRDPIASCANSLDRIHIITNKKEFYVSLKNNDKFMEDIRKNL